MAEKAWWIIGSFVAAVGVAAVYDGNAGLAGVAFCAAMLLYWLGWRFGRR